MMKYIIIALLITIIIAILLHLNIFNIDNLFQADVENKDLEKFILDKKNIDNKKLDNKKLDDKQLDEKKLESKKLEDKKLESKKLEDKKLESKKGKVDDKYSDGKDSYDKISSSSDDNRLGDLNFDQSDIFSDNNLDESDMSFDGLIDIKNNQKNNTNLKEKQLINELKDQKNTIKNEIKNEIKKELNKTNIINEKLFKDFQNYMKKVNEKKNIIEVSKMHQLASEISKKKYESSQKPVIKNIQIDNNSLKDRNIMIQSKNGDERIRLEEPNYTSVAKHTEIDNFDLTDTISGIINNELNNAK